MTTILGYIAGAYFGLGGSIAVQALDRLGVRTTMDLVKLSHRFGVEPDIMFCALRDRGAP